MSFREFVQDFLTIHPGLEAPHSFENQGNGVLAITDISVRGIYSLDHARKLKRHKLLLTRSAAKLFACFHPQISSFLYLHGSSA